MSDASSDSRLQTWAPGPAPALTTGGLPPVGGGLDEGQGRGGSIDIALYWQMLVKHRWTILAAVVICLGLGAAMTLLTKPVYEAAVTLRIDREAEKVVNPQEGTPVDNLGDEFFQTQYGILRSRALSERVADSLGLARDDRFILTMIGKTRMPTGRANTTIDRRTLVSDLLQSHEGVTPVRGSRLVDVTFNSPDPALSARIANAYADAFIGSALDQRYEASSYARDFLEKRLAQVKDKLEQSERDLVAYAASQHIIQLSGAAAGAADNFETARSLPGADLEAYNTALATARTDRIKAEQRWKQAQSAPLMGLTEVLQSPTIQQLSQEHAREVAEYQDRVRIFKPDYPDMVQLKAKIDETERQIKLEADAIRESLKGQYEAALANERSLSGQVDAQKNAVLDLRGRSIQYTILQREVDTNRTLYDGLLQRYKEVGVAGGVANNNIFIVDHAEPPRWPSRPRPLLNMLVALVAGLALGVAIAVLREAFDQAIRSPRDVESKLGLAVLGVSPTLKKGVKPREALGDPRSPFSEAYQSLRSSLQFSTTEGFPKSLLVTSATPGGGKSTTAFATAQNVARLGFRVLLVDADLRNPSVHHVTALENPVGLSNILTGSAGLKDVVQVTDVANLFVVTSGPLPPNPAELLAGPRLAALVAEATALFDAVIFDGPPVMGLADAPMIGSVTAGVLVVVECNRAKRLQVLHTLRRLATASAHVLGAVLTRYDAPHAAYGYGYGYGYDYGAPAKPRLGQAAAARVRKLVER